MKQIIIAILFCLTATLAIKAQEIPDTSKVEESIVLDTNQIEKIINFEQEKSKPQQTETIKEEKTIKEKKVEEKRSTAVQCSGTTKKGNRCKNMTKNSNGRCHLHGGK